MSSEVAGETCGGAISAEDPADLGGVEPSSHQSAARVRCSENLACGAEDLDPCLKNSDSAQRSRRQWWRVELAPVSEGSFFGAAIHT
jgi:hypothetical protein